MAGPRPGIAARIAAPLACALFAACSPTLDWRELRATDSGFVAMLPGRIASDTRALPAPLADIRLSQWSALAGDTLFAVGVAQVPDAQRASAVAAMLRAGLLANFSARITAERGLAEGWTEWTAEGRNNETPVRIEVRQRVAAGRYQQLTVIGPAARADRDATQMFWNGFRALDTK